MTNHKKQFSLFAVVGAFNTLLDIVIFNVLSLLLGVNLIVANLISTSVGMSISFGLNKRFVFSSSTQRSTQQFLVFIAVTAFGLYVIQNVCIHALTTMWPGFLEGLYNSAESIGVPFSQDFFIANSAKAIATAMSMVWNYVLYDTVVFNDTYKK